MPVAAFRESSFLWYLDDDTFVLVIGIFLLINSVPYGVEKWLQDVCGDHSVCLGGDHSVVLEN